MRKTSIGILLPGLILCCLTCDMFRWEVVDLERLGGSCVSAQALVGSALDREVVEVLLHEDCENLSSGRTLVRLEGMPGGARLRTIGEDLVEVSTHGASVFAGELHLLLNLKAASKKVEFSYLDQVKPTGPTLIDSAAGVSYRLYRMADRQDVTIMEIGWSRDVWDDDDVRSFPTTGNLLIVGADEVQPRFSDNRNLDLSVTWMGSHEVDRFRVNTPRTRVDSMAVIRLERGDAR